MTTQDPQPRPRYGEPSHPYDPISVPRPVRKIRFLHPGYPENSNILLQFSAFDANNGIYYQTALDACAIVASNRWDGFFSTDRDAQHRIQLESLPRKSLNQDEYYFHVPKQDDTHKTDKDYPIVPTFAEWQFPHQKLPPHWSRLLGEDLDTDSQPPRADCCCMTHSSLALENAHIIPMNPSDLNWFDMNIMGRYASNSSQSNTIRLKVDVHQVFDRKPQFAIIPKYGSMVAHIFNADDAIEAVQLYHNVPLQPLSGKDIRFLLARMAWTVFPHLDLFMKARVRRKLARLVNQKQEIQEIDGDKCDQIFKGARSRSVSPRKRQAGQMTQGEELLEEYDEHDDDERERDGEWQTRGRKKKRSSYNSFLPSNGSCTARGEEWRRSGSEVSESMDAAVLTSLQT